MGTPAQKSAYAHDPQLCAQCYTHSLALDGGSIGTLFVDNGQIRYTQSSDFLSPWQVSQSSHVSIKSPHPFLASFSSGQSENGPLAMTVGIWYM